MNLQKIANDELTKKAIQNEVVRFVGKGKKVIPMILPFVNRKQLDIAKTMELQGEDPANYSSPATQYDLPDSVLVGANEVKKISLRTDKDSLFLMKYLKLNAYYTLSGNFPISTSTKYNTLGRYYDKWTNSVPTGLPSANIVTGGTSGTPSEAITPIGGGNFNTQILFNGLTFIIPLYDDDSDPTATDPSSGSGQTSEDGVKYKQVQIGNMAGDGSTFDLLDMSGNPFQVKWTGNTPVFTPNFGRNHDYILPYYNRLKIALYASSPSARNIYGGLNDTPEIGDARPFVNHVERLLPSTLMSYYENSQVNREYLFPMDSTINIELENILPEAIKVNGFIFGYKIYERG
jgi:hypothetical protein